MDFYKEKELLAEQLELLNEKSKKARTIGNLYKLSNSMQYIAMALAHLTSLEQQSRSAWAGSRGRLSEQKSREN